MKNLLYLLLLLAGIASCDNQKECCVLPEKNFSFEVAAAYGCGSFYVYKELRTENLHLYVEGDRDALSLDLTEKEFDLSNENLRVEILQFDDEIGAYACDDVANDQGEVAATWSAIAGTASIQITEDSISVQPWEMIYKITIKLKGVEVENELMEKANLSDTDFEEVLVGWLPG